MITLEQWLNEHPGVSWTAHYGEDQHGGFGKKGWSAYGAGNNAWGLYVMGVNWETHKRPVVLDTRLRDDGKVDVTWGTEDDVFADVIVTIKLFWDEDHGGAK